MPMNQLTKPHAFIRQMLTPAERKHTAPFKSAFRCQYTQKHSSTCYWHKHCIWPPTVHPIHL